MDREKKVQEVLQLAERLCMHVDHGIPPEAAEVEALRALIQELKAPPESRCSGNTAGQAGVTGAASRPFPDMDEKDVAMAKEPKKLDELFHDTLKDIYYAEKKILAALPKMAKAAESDELRAAFEKHATETEEQVTRLEEVFGAIDAKPQGKKCAAIEGILEEGKEIMSEYKGSPALDAGLLAAAQAVEHYEISRYGTLRTWAEELGLDDAATLLETTLKEEEATDETLTGLAKELVNAEAQDEAA